MPCFYNLDKLFFSLRYNRVHVSNITVFANITCIAKIISCLCEHFATPYTRIIVSPLCHSFKHLEWKLIYSSDTSLLQSNNQSLCRTSRIFVIWKRLITCIAQMSIVQPGMFVTFYTFTVIISAYPFLNAFKMLCSLTSVIVDNRRFAQIAQTRLKILLTF